MAAAPHYQIQYDDSLSQADGMDRANALIAACEQDYALMSGWFGVLKLAGATMTALMLQPNGTRFGGWLLNTADNHFVADGRFSGGTEEVLVTSPWGHPERQHDDFAHAPAERDALRRVAAEHCGQHGVGSPSR